SSLALVSAGSITDAAGATLSGSGPAAFDAGSHAITPGGNAADVTHFRALTLTRTAPSISQDSATRLTGAHNAPPPNPPHARSITGAAGTPLPVSGPALFAAGSNAIPLGDNGADVTNFGSLTFPGTAVSISEDSATVLTGVNSATSLNLTSAGSITDAAGTTLTVSGLAVFDAGSNAITLGDDAAHIT